MDLPAEKTHKKGRKIMEFEDIKEDFDGKAEEQEEKNEQEEKKEEEKAKFDVADFAMEYIMNMYAFSADVKKKGHATLSDMLFKDAMGVYLSATLATWSMGRDKFMKYIDDGFYASGRIIEYLKILETMGVAGDNLETVRMQTFRMHKMYRSSINTMKSKLVEICRDSYM